MLDDMCKNIVGKNLNMAVPWFLMTSFLYYRLDAPVVTDECFDSLCKILNNNWDQITHFHKHLITRGDLEAGTGFAIEYPLRVENAALRLKDLT